MVVTGLPLAAVGRIAERGPSVEEWERLLSLRVGSAWPDGQPVFGSYEVAGAEIRFTPRFPLSAGIVYRGRFDGKAFDEFLAAPELGTPSRTVSFEITEEDIPSAVPSSTSVVAAYPSAAEIPENALRLYVEFSAPMRARDVARHIHWFDDQGGEVQLPFVEIPDGLWDQGQRRLTLFFHPGRLKRGVGPNLVLGPPLQVGRSYRLVIDATLVDAAGRPLAGRFERTFRVVAADRRSPDVESWRLTAPAADRSPVILDFPEPLDHGLLRRLLWVVGPGGEAVAGETRLAGDESRWSFFPDEPWRPGDYEVRIDPDLEDLAGNSIERTFERSQDAASNEVEAAPVTRPRAVGFSYPPGS